MEPDRPLLHRSFEGELETKEGRLVEGCVVPYGTVQKVRDSADGPVYQEMFEPGAFRRQLGAADKVELRYEHRDGLADSVGICRTLWEDANGLYGTFAVHVGAFGDQALELIRTGILPGFSIGAYDRLSRWKRNAEGVVVRANCYLEHVGLVRRPAYVGAVITTMRSRQDLLADLGEFPEVPDEQRERLRAVGISV